MTIDTLLSKYVGRHVITFCVEDLDRGIESAVDQTITIEIVDPCAPQQITLTSFETDQVTYSLREQPLVYHI